MSAERVEEARRDSGTPETVDDPAPAKDSAPDNAPAKEPAPDKEPAKEPTKAPAPNREPAREPAPTKAPAPNREPAREPAPAKAPAPDKATARADKPGQPASATAVPQRYVIREDENGRYLTCLGAQNLFVRIDAKESVSAAAAKRAAGSTIFLDGAAQGEPFMAVQQRVYNLDHHEGCVRSFTLATCEQAMVMVRRGLDLRAGEWTIRGGEPDLDTVLAIWVLLNHPRLTEQDPTVRKAVMPLVRLEGVIDAHGLGMVDLSALPDALLEETHRVIEKLRVRELELKQTGKWAKADFLAYTAEVLHAIDREVYEPEQLRDFPEIDELARVQITDERMAIVCRSNRGIYEIEAALREQHGDRVGLVVLAKDDKTYTLRQVDSFLPVGLDDLYERLNLLDGAVRGSNRWGGSAEIGGSPRGTGTALPPQRIARIVRTVYQPATFRRKIAALAVGVGQVVALIAAALAIAALAGWRPGAGNGPSLAELGGEPWYALVFSLASAGVFAAHAWRNRRLYGAQRPIGFSWLILAPAAVLAGAAGGAWLVPERAGDGNAALAVGVPLAIAAELLFRGVVHGRLAADFRVNGKWRISTPNAVSAALSAAASFAVFAPSLIALGGFAAVWRLLLCAPAAVALGLACGIARERSESVSPAAMLHLLAVFTAAHVSAIGI